MTYANGPITALGSSSISVQTMTCTIGPSSPLARAASRSATRADVLPERRPLPAQAHRRRRRPPPPRRPPRRPRRRPRTNYRRSPARSPRSTASSITVTGGDSDRPASLTCTIGPARRRTSGFAIGNSVRMYCLNGALYQLQPQRRRLRPPRRPRRPRPRRRRPTPPNYSGSAARSPRSRRRSISVTAATTPPRSPARSGRARRATSGFAVGNSVRMYCLNGALYQLRHNDRRRHHDDHHHHDHDHDDDEHLRRTHERDLALSGSITVERRRPHLHDHRARRARAASRSATRADVLPERRALRLTT